MQVSVYPLLEKFCVVYGTRRFISVLDALAKIPKSDYNLRYFSLYPYVRLSLSLIP